MAGETADGEAVPDGFITLPPGLVDSITVREPAPRTERPTSDEIVFFTGPAATTPATPADATPEVVAPEGASRGAAPPEPAQPTAVPRWRLVLEAGDELAEIDSAVLLGRNPGPDPRFPGALLVPVPDPGKSVSKTHAALEIQQGELWVHDLDSTNGVLVVEHDDEVTEVRPGLRTRVQPGWTVELGTVRIGVRFD